MPASIVTPTGTELLQVASGGSASYMDQSGFRAWLETGARPMWYVADFGDSRGAAGFLDGLGRVRGGQSELNHANSLMGQRMVIGPNFSKSGDRSDHLFARLASVIASGVGVVRLRVALNNLGAVATGFTYKHVVTGETVTISTVADVTFRDIRDLCDAMRFAGIRVVLENETGGETLNTAEKVIAWLSLRSKISQYAEATPGIYYHDAYTALMQNGVATPVFKAGYSYDGTHSSPRGAYWHGKSLMSVMASAITGATRSPLIMSAAEVDVSTAAGRRQLLNNSLFLTATGGTSGAGVTGSTPGSFNSTVIGGATATVSTAANASGLGNGFSIAATFNASGDGFRLAQSLNGSGANGGTYNANLRPGDKVEGFAQIELTSAPVNLSALFMTVNAVTAGSGGVSFLYGDMVSPILSGELPSRPGINDTAILTFRTGQFLLPDPTAGFPYLTALIEADAMGAGSFNGTVRQFGVRRVDS